MKAKAIIRSLLPVCLLILAALACGTSSSNVGTKVTSAPSGGSSGGDGNGETGVSTPVPPSGPTIYHVGDTVEVGTQTITLNSANFTGGELTANFTIQNNGSKELAISTIIQFSAKDSEGTKLDEDFMNCGSSIGGTLQPGDKSKGDICYKGATTETVKIYYEAELFGEGAVIFEVKK